MPLSDTHPDIERIQIELMRRAPVWRRLDLLGQLNQTLKTLAISGLRQRYPQASQTELQRRLADMILGEELAAKAYGPYSGEHPSSTPPRLP
jgi:hypothetical protein